MYLPNKKEREKAKLIKTYFQEYFYGVMSFLLSRVSRIVSGVPIIPSNKIIYLFEKSITIITNHDKLNWTLNVE